MVSKKTKSKKTWHEPVVSRVKLNPEQAVLQCCNVAERGRMTVGGDQCDDYVCVSAINPQAGST